MSHLAPDELIDAIDGTLAAARRGHLDVCDACRGEAARLRDMLSEVRASNVPDPSPLFWDRFSARVRAAIDGQPPAPRTRWFEVPVLAPLAGLALVVLALVSMIGGRGTVDVTAPVVQLAGAAAGGDLLDIDSQWALVADLVGDLDLDTAQDAGIALSPGSAERVVAQMSAIEQQELIRLVREELRTGG